MTQRNIYIAMYRALDCLYDENPNNALGEFLSEANPYLFKDRCSADPAIQKDFEGFVDEKMNAEDAYKKVQQYILSKTNFANLFSDITLQEWVALCDIVENEEASSC